MKSSAVPRSDFDRIAYGDPFSLPTNSEEVRLRRKALPGTEGVARRVVCESVRDLLPRFSTPFNWIIPQKRYKMFFPHERQKKTRISFVSEMPRLIEKLRAELSLFALGRHIWVTDDVGCQSLPLAPAINKSPGITSLSLFFFLSSCA